MFVFSFTDVRFTFSCGGRRLFADFQAQKIIAYILRLYYLVINLFENKSTVAYEIVILHGLFISSIHEIDICYYIAALKMRNKYKRIRLELLSILRTFI